MTARPTERSPWAPLNAPLIGLIHAYRVVLSPVMGGQCRFHPSCSAYALEVCRTFGPPRAIWLIARRLLRCHPLGGSGIDPAPPYRRGRVQAGGDP